MFEAYRVPRLALAGELWAAGELGARGGRREQNIRGSEYFERQIARISASDFNLDVARFVGRHRRSGLTMLVEDRRTDGSDAVLHHEIVAVVGQCVSRRVVVQSRNNRADAAAFRSGLGVYLIESNFRKGYAVLCLRIRFVQFLDTEALETDRFFLDGPRCRGNECNRFSALGKDDDANNRDNGHGNGGEAKRS